MEQKFPELHLGDNHWKADLIATLNYPSWYNNNASVEKEEHSKCTSVDPLPEAKRLRTSTDPPPPSITHKKRTKCHTRDIVKAADSQSSIVRLLSHYNAIIYLQTSQNSSLIAGPKNYANHSSMQCEPPVSAIVSSRDPDTRPRSRVNCIFISTA